MSQQNLSVNVTVSFDEQKVAALVKEFQHRLVNESLIVTTSNPKKQVQDVTINVNSDADVETIKERINKANRPSVVMGG